MKPEHISGDVKELTTMTSGERQRMLICNRSQFGYHIDTYYYCKYLRAEFALTYVGWDYGRPRVEVDGVRVIYVSRAGSKIARYLRFLWAAYKESRDNYSICFFKYFYGCSLLKIGLGQCRCICDIRTVRVVKNALRRVFHDSLMKLESFFFENVTVISESLKARLFPGREGVFILPLGSDVISNSKKNFHVLNLLYVGTLENRNVEQTVIGFEKFYQEHREGQNIRYTIVGDGYRGESSSLQKMVQQRNLDHVVFVTGRIPHEELKPYFENHNIGVSYIPLTDYFDCQPPTKTFEYLLSGMVVLATKTTENRRVVNDANGVLVEDTAESFAAGLKQIYDRRHTYCSDGIRAAGLPHTWENIVRGKLEPYLQSL